MKSLKAIQILAKIGKIISTIIFICCIVGTAGCVTGIISLVLLPDTIRIDGMTLHGLIARGSGMSMGTIYSSITVGLILCLGELFLAKIAANYFRNEIKAGTPFTLQGAKELLRLGICAIAIPFVSTIIAEIAHSIFNSTFSNVSEISLGSSFSSCGLGVTFIIVSLLCRYGAQMIEAKESEQ